MGTELPAVVTLSAEVDGRAAYDNHPVAAPNDHVVRISRMTEPYHWHLHPDSDETFLVIEGRLRIELPGGALELGPGQMTTVPKGTAHRTLPVGPASVNLTVERAGARTLAVERDG